ncbi:hypothetical protein F2P81_005100 [Scophthalmus maximus]|uniref:Uncharacterized protein n=1 Tax=Scophthalmus maximus TaxID=52904 RepID=A0A6A4TAX6_SCOMX|nr:hypothetical protein F2P81_005100 [Scophthalmus maximus]
MELCGPLLLLLLLRVGAAATDDRVASDRHEVYWNRNIVFLLLQPTGVTSSQLCFHTVTKDNTATESRASSSDCCASTEAAPGPDLTVDGGSGQTPGP